MKSGYRNECKACMNELNKRYKLTCENCGKVFKTHFKEQQCCSRECSNEFIIKTEKRKNEKHWNWSGGGLFLKCEWCGKKASKKKHQAEKNIYNYCSRQCNGKHAEFIGRFVGENSTSYNPELTEEDREDRRKKPEHKKWTKEVYKKDNFACVICGTKRNLQAHHIDGYNWCKEKRTDVNNGATLCKEHHKDFHNEYGYGWNNKEQFEEFLKRKGVVLCD